MELAYEGEKFYWTHHDKIEIDFCIDNRTAGGIFRGIPIYSYEEKKNELHSCLIVVAAIYDTYRAIAGVLSEGGLCESVDFLWEEYLYKDIALLYGNCHMGAI